jgi:hypothetical protein
VLRAGSVPSSPHNFVVLETKAHLAPNLGLGSTSKGMIKVFDTPYIKGIASYTQIMFSMGVLQTKWRMKAI